MKQYKKHSKNNTNHRKYKFTYYQNIHTYTHPHITKQVETTTVQDTCTPNEIGTISKEKQCAFCWLNAVKCLPIMHGTNNINFKVKSVVV